VSQVLDNVKRRRGVEKLAFLYNMWMARAATAKIWNALTGMSFQHYQSTHSDWRRSFLFQRCFCCLHFHCSWSRLSIAPTRGSRKAGSGGQLVRPKFGAEA